MQMLRFLAGFLFDEPKDPLWRYCLIAFPLALLPSLVLMASVVLALEAFGVDMSAFRPPARHAIWWELFGSVLFVPAVETLILSTTLWLLSALSRRKMFVITTSAVLWGCAHGAQSAPWFFGTVWSFFVFSCTFLVWRKKSFLHAFIAAAVPHALVNLSVVISMVVEDISKTYT
jgi:hypothetical protein